jgi:multidrug resistance protein MdtO
VVTAISAWIGTASARLSYLGVQLALAFYLINLQEFAIQTSLSFARDRVFGVLLGLLSMWLLFDRLWVRNALDEMETVFAHNLEIFAELAEQLLVEDQVQAIRRIRKLRDQINEGFQAVTAQSDAVLFEFGPSRQQKLQIREDISRWQPSVRTLLQVQVTAAQYLSHQPLKTLPKPIAAAGLVFEKDIALMMRELAREVSRQPSGVVVPDIRQAAARMRQETTSYFGQLGVPVAAAAADLTDLAESLATILDPLYRDIHTVFASPGGHGGTTVQLAPSLGFSKNVTP